MNHQKLVKTGWMTLPIAIITIPLAAWLIAGNVLLWGYLVAAIAFLSTGWSGAMLNHARRIRG